MFYNKGKMTDEILDDYSIERLAQEEFGIKVDIKQVVVRNAPTGRNSAGTLFLTTDNKLYLYIKAQATMLLDDVRKIVGRMGLEADDYLPPHGDKQYFDDVALDRFRSTFPGRTLVSADDDLRFYKQLAPYNPALVRIAAVKTPGNIKQWDPDSSDWRIAATLHYRRIKTS
jgi:hypothetical protein